MREIICWGLVALGYVFITTITIYGMMIDGLKTIGDNQ